ncbi:unnamed protein product [Symbiodinium necroappetens]|uniref:Uncharacterized protein n=1 Tax=Symbiodinium necroappetens TaxID=1628268 RepID=A0A812YNS6_9DINO|nr:unnamed protein product [Symbiodinium necroappetens]
MSSPHENRTRKTAAWECSKIDFKSFTGSGADSQAVQDLMTSLEISKYCGKYKGDPKAEAAQNPTCLAFWAGMEAHMQLQREGVKPVFNNMMVVNWFANEPGHYPSWGSTDDITVTYAKGEAKTVTVKDNNAVTGYAFCDIVHTILRQNFDQAQRGQCAPTAVLMALSNVNPAKAIKIGLELFWTGTFHGVPPQFDQCHYIYDDMPPGVVPFDVGQPGTEGSGSKPLPMPCLGNANDCEQSTGAPNTNAGLQGMWAIKMTALRDFATAKSCDACARKAWVTYPGMSPEHQALISDGWFFGPLRQMMEILFQAPVRLDNMPNRADQRFMKETMDLICSMKGGAVVGIASSVLKMVNIALHKVGAGSRERPWRSRDWSWRCGENQWSSTSDHAAYIDSCDGDIVSIWTWSGRLFIDRETLLTWGSDTKNGLPCPGESGPVSSALFEFIEVPHPGSD